RWIKQPLQHRTLRNFLCYKPLFELFGDFYDLSWSLIAAVAFVESGFDPKTRSHKGAVGLMQIKPSIARMFDIYHLEQPYNNIMAGSAYLAWLRDNYYNDPVYSADDRINFTLAAYNAGPTRIRKLQQEAKRAGLDPYKWFYNVELIARRRIGQETVNYVSQVRKTRTAIRMLYTLQRHKLQLRQQLISADTP
ncbi:MAG TPA: lytic transglycosylase F, partial [Piscirickettsiaceae bacterium]|nr:lytic transglycosylase F [Piscirickettsiaceae bacterium]